MAAPVIPIFGTCQHCGRPLRKERVLEKNPETGILEHSEEMILLCFYYKCSGRYVIL